MLGLRIPANSNSDHGGGHVEPDGGMSDSIYTSYHRVDPA